MKVISKRRVPARLFATREVKKDEMSKISGGIISSTDAGFGLNCPATCWRSFGSSSHNDDCDA